jgi:presenilin-like A22 family membrane protease
LKLKPSDLIGPAGLALFILAVQLLSLALVSPLDTYQLRAFENPESIWNPIIYIVLIIAFTAVLLLIIKFNVRWLIQAFIALAVFSTLIYVLFALGVLVLPGVDALFLAAAAVAIAAVLTLLMIVYPEWYVIDSVGIMTASGAAALFGISLTIVPTLLLLIILAVYDFISVYKTRHMIRLAEGVMDLKLPVLFVLPRRLGYSYVRSKAQKLGQGEREAYFMGLGDAVMPTILAVSANAFVEAPSLGFINVPALGAVIGTLISHAALMYFVLKGKPQAGLPFLCTGAILGFLAGCAVAGVNPFF